ncbi:hypothetical protein L6R52_10345 [Myxococcota bacterium]|nr:hypothetical protein [Myxococcota bacterium]
MVRRLSASVVLVLVAAACAFGGTDEPSNTCTSSSQCDSGEVCNLVARRCEPAQIIEENRLVATFECTRFDLGATEPGTARLQANFGGEVIDLGAGCFARVTEGLVTMTIIAGERSDGRAVDIRAMTDATLPANLTMGTECALWLEKLDPDLNTLPWAYAPSGQLELLEVSDQRVVGSVEVTLAGSAPRGGACTGPEDWMACGSPSTAMSCSLADPSGAPVCREICASAEACEADESCADVEGVTLCIPSELVVTGDPPCGGTSGHECDAGRVCVSGAVGDPSGLFCRRSCPPLEAPSCPLGEVCATLSQNGQPTGEGACFPDPCATSSCSPGTACSPSNATETTCVTSGRISGAFSVVISTVERPTPGTGSASGSIPGSTFPASGRAVSTVLDGETDYLAIVLGSTDTTDRPRMIYLLVPAHFAVADRALVAPWEVLGQFVRGEEIIGVAVHGWIDFDAVGLDVGDAVQGTYALDFVAGDGS